MTRRENNSGVSTHQLKPRLVVSCGENAEIMMSFEDIRAYRFPELPGARDVEAMVLAAHNETEIVLAASMFATWAKRHGLLLTVDEGNRQERPSADET